MWPTNEHGPLAHLAVPRDPDHSPIGHWINVSPSYTNMAFKRQVLRPSNPFSFHPERSVYTPQTRLSHTMVVSQIANILGYELGLNTDLINISALGHDIAHVGKGHFGEVWIRLKTGRSFFHEYANLHVLQNILSIPLDLVLQKSLALHSWSTKVMTRTDVCEEARVVSLADKFAYVCFDSVEVYVMLQLGGYGHLIYTPEEAKRLSEELVELITALTPVFTPMTYIPRVGDMAEASLEEHLALMNSEYQFPAMTWAMTHDLEAIALAESREAGRVQFQENDRFQAFINLKNWLSKNIYQKADEKGMESNEMEGAYAFLSEHFPEHDPMHLIIFLMDDLKIRRAAHFAGHGTPEWIDPQDSSLDLYRDITWDMAWLLERIPLRESAGYAEFDRLTYHTPEWVKPPTS